MTNGGGAGATGGCGERLDDRGRGVHRREDDEGAQVEGFVVIKAIGATLIATVNEPRSWIWSMSAWRGDVNVVGSMWMGPGSRFRRVREWVWNQRADREAEVEQALVVPSRKRRCADLPEMKAPVLTSPELAAVFDVTGVPANPC